MRTHSAQQKAKSLASSAALFAALGDETRLQLVARLCDEGPTSIVKLTEGAHISRQAVSKHLRSMEDAGLVRVTRSGRETVWELQPQRLVDARGYLEQISKQWDAALDRLRALVED